MIIQKAKPSDCSFLAAFRREIIEEHRPDLAKKVLDELEDASILWFKDQMSKGLLEAYILFQDSQVLASACLSFQALQPVYPLLSRTQAYIFNLATKKDQRRKGYAQALVEEIIADCKTKKICRLYLQASDSARDLYIKAGFKIAEEEYLSLRL